MAMNFAKMAAPNFKIQLSGEEVEAAPLTLYDLSKIEEWARAETIKAAVVALKAIPDISAELKNDVLDKAFNTAQLLSFVDLDADEEDEEGAAETPMQAMMSSIGGVIYLVYCSLAKCNEITVEQLGTLKQDDLKEVAGQIMIRSGFAKEDSADAKTKSVDVPDIPRDEEAVEA